MNCRFCEEKADEDTGLCPTCTEFIGRMQILLKVDPLLFLRYLRAVLDAAEE
jgi:hypothetical protein